MAYNLGVDLGTSFVAAATALPGRTEMFTLGDQSVVTPALVYRLETGELLTGDAAGRRALSNPDRLAREFKRRLGDPTPIVLGGSPQVVIELLGTLLRDVLGKVSAVEGRMPERVVLTHPANWGPFRRGLFEQVPAAAGLAEAGFITEPEAAGVNYASTRGLRDGQLIAVYDLGGGTFDAAVLRKRANGVEIIGVPEGIERLGGIDFDDAILNHVNFLCDGVLDELDKREPAAIMTLARLRQDCVRAKEALSVDTETVLPVLLPNRQIDVRLTRAQFEDLVRAMIESTIGALLTTLRSAQIAPADLDAILMIGGSSRIPLVAQMVSAELGRPTVVDSNPKYSVALGAARLAGAPSTSGSGPGPLIVDRAITRMAADPVASRPSRSLSRRPTGRRSRRAMLLVSSAVLLVVLLVAGFVLLVGSAPPGREEPAFTGGTNPLVLAPPLHPQVATSLGEPTLGVQFPVGPTPEFLSVSPNGRLAYVANGNEKAVTVIDTSINRAIARVVVDTGPPRFLTFSRDGRRLYASIFDDQGGRTAVAVIDTTTNTVIATIPLRGRPFRAALTPDGSRLYVPGYESGTVTVIDTATNAVVEEFNVPSNPSWVEFTPDGGRAFVAHNKLNEVSVLDVAAHAVVAEIPVGASPVALAMHPSRPLLAEVNYDSDSVYLIDITTNKVVATIPVGNEPRSMVWTPDGKFGYVVDTGDSTVSLINSATNQISATVPTGVGNPTTIAVLPDGRRAYVGDPDSGTLAELITGG